MWRRLLCILWLGSLLAGMVRAGGAAPDPASRIPTDLARALARVAPDADPDVLQLAQQAMVCAAAAGIPVSERLALIDYSRPSTTPRLWVFDLAQHTLLFHELVAHGRNSGENITTSFSNQSGSHESSLGLFLAQETYEGDNGYSLRMDGLEPGFNDNARERAIVMHGAPYVDEAVSAKLGRLGRSLGCPAVRSVMAHPIIDTLKGGQFVFSYYPDAQWLSESRLLNCQNNTSRINER
jgi:hypothetical protein